VRRTIFLVPVFAAILMIAHPSSALAEFAVCNSSTYGTVNVAYVATWQDSQGTTHGQSQGWWQIETNKCQIVITTEDVSGYTLYIYAFAQADPSKELWGGENNFCLDPKNKFLYQGNAIETPCSSGKPFGMRLMDSGGVSQYTYYLRD